MLSLLSLLRAPACLRAAGAALRRPITFSRSQAASLGRALSLARSISILVALRGKSATNSTKRGTLKAAMRVRHHSISSTGSGCVPAGMMNTFTSASPSSEGTPTAITSRTAGWAAITDSTSWAEMFSPRRRIQCAWRPVKYSQPSASRWPRSPVCIHRLPMQSRVRCGLSW